MDYYIGWDVGGWNCDRNPNSRDAIAILDADGALTGRRVWRGNLRQSINDAPDAQTWIAALFALCGASPPAPGVAMILAIDTPLGFSDEFRHLLAGEAVEAIGDDFSRNPYLYRQTEIELAKRGRQPLSPLKDMIGSQAAKGIHVLSRFGLESIACGVWRNETANLTAIEAYPGPSKHSPTLRVMQAGIPGWAALQGDCQDAITCALLGQMFDQQRNLLFEPLPTVSPAEGWIWVPNDALEPSPGP
ncbi:hypothetical protein [Magnetofaba australis]|uniref:DUF429 domain-containing protein n=1 Tax=Magnetofaba australis IT-1 TaxID=1434232 RepID=A0A1Y2K7I9_9PROT|nr:hypothetical protein [Magnetofaba australis]OSM04431.1 hypothetical protein MAIT1_04343 [Magnetofaba australis IT-1]